MQAGGMGLDDVDEDGSRRSAGCDAQAGQHGTRLPVGLQPGGEVELTLAYKPSSGLATRYKLLGLYRAS